MNERVALLRDSVVKITQLLSGKGIEVTQRGINAYVKADSTGRPVVVNLPYLPDNATEELCFAIQGFLDHEVAHILFSDFNLMGVANKEGVGAFLNVLEDARIEKAMAARFSGSGHNLAVTGKFFLDKYTTPMMAEAAKKGDANGVIGILFVPLLRGMSGQFLFKEFMKDNMTAVNAIYSKIADMEPAIVAATSTQDCLELAREIKRRLKSSGEEEGGEDEGEGDGKEGGDGEGVKKSTKAGKKPSKDKKEKSEDKKEPKDKSEEKATSGADEKGEGEESGENEGDEGSDGEGKGEGEGDESSGSDADGEGESSVKSSVEAERKADAKSAAIMAAIDKEAANGYDETLSSMISAAAASSAKSAGYLVYSRDKDQIEPLKVGRGYAPKMFESMASKVDHMVGPLQKDLERAVAARSMASWQSGKRSGRLHSANLSRLTVGDPRVFRQRHASDSKDVAVSLVVDASGSMSGERIHLATQAAYALSSVLERIGITHEVICFTTGGRVASSMETSAEEKKIGRAYSRHESLYMPIIKGFAERIRADIKERFGWLPNSSILSNNVDGECVEIAARRLMMRREAGKVMIVLSDGSPSADGNGNDLRRHLKEVVAQVTKKGIKVVGIGIQTTEVKNFYPKSIVINKVDELPGRVIKELRDVLLG